MTKIIKKYKINIIASISIFTIGLTGLIYGNYKIIEEKNEIINTEPVSHDVELSDENTIFIDSAGEYEIWVIAYYSNGNEVINVNIKTDKRKIADAMFIDLNNHDDGYKFVGHGDENDTYGRNVWVIDDAVAGLGMGWNTFFNQVSPTHNLCKGNQSVITQRKDSCTVGIDGIYLDYQNIFRFYLSDY